MDNLVRFLRDRLDEDEAAAKSADGDKVEATPSLWGTKYLTLRGSHDDRHTTELPADLADHIARHDPARVLAEVEAKRWILECHEPWAAGNGDIICGRCGREHIDGRPGGHFPCQTLRLLALPFADHPDYDEAWRP